MKSTTTLRRGFTIMEMLAVVMIIGMLVGLLLPSVQSLRERARQISCSNNLMQVGLGFSGYHASFDQLPVQLSGTDGSTKVGADNDRRLSAFVALLPFLGHDGTLERMNGELPFGVRDQWVYGADGELLESVNNDDKELWVAGGPEPFQKNYDIWWTSIPEFRCPSDPGVGMPAFARTNYAICLGDGVVAMNTGPYKEVKGVFQWDEQRAAQTEAAMRGVFVPRVPTTFRDITDGRSHTIMLGEIATHLSDRDIRTSAVIGPGEAVLRDRPNWVYEAGIIDTDRPFFWQTKANLLSDTDGSVARGYRWADGAPLFTAFNTILPPNHALSASGKSEMASGIFPPSSRHSGAVGVCMADGSVRFINDSIDAGDRNSPTPYLGSKNTPDRASAYGVWGAMGTRASEELVFAKPYP